MDYLNIAVFIRKKITTGANYGDWVDPANAIALLNVSGIKVTRSLGGQTAKRDSFSFNINNENNSLFEHYYSGNGITTQFTLPYFPIPVQHLSGNLQKFYIYLNGVQLKYTTDYSISSSTLTFVNAPITGNRNIRIVYPIIETNDLIRIYRWKDIGDFSDLSSAQKEQALVEGIEGPINEPSLSLSSRNVVSVNGQGLIDAIMSGMAFAQNPAVYDYAHLQIQAIIAQLNQFNPNRKIYGANPTEWTNLSNGTTTKKIAYTSKYRTAVEMIQDLSGDTYTGNGQYIFYVNFNSTALDANGYTGRYEFIWQPKQTQSTSTISETGDYIEKIDESKTTDDVVNCVIFNAGADLNGYGIEGLNFDFSFTGYGLKWQYISSTSYLFNSIVSQEVSTNIAEFPVDSNNKPTSQFPSSYPYTFVTIKTRDSLTGESLGGTIVAANATEYNQALRNEALALGKMATKTIINLYNRPRFDVKVQFGRASNQQFALGGVYTMQFPSFGINNRLMRIYGIDYNYDSTIVTFKEDEITLQYSQGNIY